MTLFDIRPAEGCDRLEAHRACLPAAASPSPTVWRQRRRNGEVFDCEIIADAIVF